MQVLVTGGAGYLGSILCARMLEEDWHVTVLDNLAYGQTSLFHLCHSPKFDFVRGDARDERILNELLKTADAIVPLACLVGAPACDTDPWTARSVNLEAILCLDRLRSNNQFVVYPTTNSGYGSKSGDVFCTEETPLEPISLYGRTKSQAEAALLGSGNAVTLRLATVFGMSPRMRLDLLVNHFVYAAVTDGYLVMFEQDFKRNYVHIRDVADCIVYCIRNAARMKDRPYNCGLDSANLSKKELALRVKAQVPNFCIQSSELRSDPDKRNYVVSNQRLREAGFEAKRSIDEGIRELLRGFRMLPRTSMTNY